MKSLLQFPVNWANKTDVQLWWTTTAGHTMAQIHDHWGNTPSSSLTLNFYRCSECLTQIEVNLNVERRNISNKLKTETPTSRWGCWRRWRGWWGPGRRHTAARGGRRPPRSSLSAARAASFLVTGSTPGHWEALRDRWRRAAGHPGTWRNRRGHRLIIHLKTRGCWYVFHVVEAAIICTNYWFVPQHTFTSQRVCLTHQM